MAALRRWWGLLREDDGELMIGSFIGFFELGAIILSWMIVWNYLIRTWCAKHSNHPMAQGLAATIHA